MLLLKSTIYQNDDKFNYAWRHTVFIMAAVSSIKDVGERKNNTRDKNNNDKKHKQYLLIMTIINIIISQLL
jgi:hypothetical protein